MSIEKLPNGRGYKVRWRDSANRSRSKTVRLQQDAFTLDGEMKRRRAMGELIAHERGKERLCDFWNVWWTNYAAANLAPKTLDVYKRLWKKHVTPVLGRTSLRSLTAEDCAALVAQLSMTLSPATVRQCMAILQGVLQRAVEWEYIPTNPARGVRKPRLVQRRGRALTAKQVAALRKELDPRSSAIVGLLAGTGIRPGELRGLRWGDISADSIRVYAPKTNRERTVTLRPEARSTLVEWYLASGQPSDRERVLPAVRGGTWTENGWRLWTRQTFKPAAERAGLRGIRPYDLRHTFVTTLIYEGRPAHEVAKQAGHSVVVCMTTYAQEFESVPSECPANVDRGETFRARLRI